MRHCSLSIDVLSIQVYKDERASDLTTGKCRKY